MIGSLALSRQNLCAQSILLSSVRVTNQTVNFQVQGPSGAYIRVDSSADLEHWLPVDLYLNTNAGGLHGTTDVFDPTNSTQFYMAHEVEPDLEVLALLPAVGGPGTQLDIIGQFYPPEGQFVVEIGGEVANVVSETSTRIVVTVPSNMVSSQVTVGSTNGLATSGGVFVSLSNVVARFQPPTGLAASGFVVADNYGVGTLVPDTVGDYSLPVRMGSPTMIFAAGSGAESNLFFSAVAFGPGQTVLLNAASTAQTLVFQNPNLLILLKKGMG